MSLDRIDFQGSELLPERIAGALRKARFEKRPKPTLPKKTGKKNA